MSNENQHELSAQPADMDRLWEKYMSDAEFTPDEAIALLDHIKGIKDRGREIYRPVIDSILAKISEGQPFTFNSIADAGFSFGEMSVDAFAREYANRLEEVTAMEQKAPKGPADREQRLDDQRAVESLMFNPFSATSDAIMKLFEKASGGKFNVKMGIGEYIFKMRE